MTRLSNGDELCSADQREYYKLYRDRITAEDTLVSNRLTWLLLTQAILYGFCATSFFSKEGLSIGGLALVALLGSVICVLGKLSIEAALTTIEQLRDHYAKNCPHTDPKLPPLTAEEGIHIRGKLAAKSLPMCFIAGWLLLFLFGIAVGLHKWLV